MRVSRSISLIIMAAVLTAYYLVCGIYLNKLGYYNHESLFYIEKSKIVFEGMGNRLKVMGLTAPILPFYTTFIFAPVSYTLAPVLASAIGTAMLFFIMASTLVKKLADGFYRWLLLALFLLHPGILYAACSGKGVYLILIFFFVFFLNLFKYYRSNTTFHVSIASISLVGLIFCNYKFVWLTLFFLPLVLSITLHSLNLGEKESIFRLFQSLNSRSLRRKLINKTLSLYIILFILPLVAVFCYKLLNLTHANDLNYFNESPYATWNVIYDKLNFNELTASAGFNIPEISILLSVRAVLFCPMILIALYLYRESTYQMLTLLTPFALIEFLHVKYDRVFLAYHFYLLFIVLAFLGVILKSQTVKNQKAFKIILSITMLVQLFMGGYYLKTSLVAGENNFVSLLINRTKDTTQTDNFEVANYLNKLPPDARTLIDDAIAYPVIAFTHNISPLIMPYGSNFLSALESPDKYANYILIATANNNLTGYTQLNEKYMSIIEHAMPRTSFRKVYKTSNWIIYQVNTH